MKNACKYCGSKYCLCNACQSMRQALEEAEKIPKEEIDELFKEAEKECDNIKM